MKREKKQILFLNFKYKVIPMIFVCLIVFQIIILTFPQESIASTNDTVGIKESQEIDNYNVEMENILETVEFGNDKDEKLLEITDENNEQINNEYEIESCQYLLASENDEKKEIVIKDSSLYDALKSELKEELADSNDETKTLYISASVLENITELNLLTYSWQAVSSNSWIWEDTYISDCSGLKEFYNLKKLSIGITLKEIEVNIEDIYQLKSLESLAIGGEGGDRRGIVNLNELKNNLTNLKTLNFLNMKNLEINNIELPETLESLTIYDCENISDLEMNLEKNINLKKLYVRYCDLSNINNIKFSNTIEKIDFSGCEIKNIENIKWPANIDVINLSVNQIEKIEKVIWGDNLRILDMSSNNITDISEINLPTNIKKLYLGNNLIENIESLSTCTSLETLCLGNNKYINDITTIEKLTNLSYVNFGNRYLFYYVIGVSNQESSLAHIGNKGNNIKNINIKWPENIKSINVENNNIEGISNVKFPLGTKYINLQDNKILDISQTNINELEDLNSIDLSNNQITDISDLHLSDLPVEDVNLDNNKIQELPKTWSNTIETLILSSNEISNLEGIIWPNNLDSLSLDDNNISNIQNVKWNNRLRYLILNNNNITSIANAEFPSNLQALELANNGISNIDGIQNAKSLIALALSNNNIKDISLLVNLENLKELVINDNNIEDVSSLEQCTALTTLNIKNQIIVKTANEIDGIPQIFKTANTEDSLVYSEEIKTVFCEINSDNINCNFESVNVNTVCIKKGNAEGTTLYITSDENIFNNLKGKKYYINNETEFRSLSNLVNGGTQFSGITVELVKNLDLGAYYDSKTNMWKGEKCTSIGTLENSFKGTFDGKGYTIKGVFIESEEDNQGLFGVNEGIIRNIVLKDSIIIGKEQVGGIVRTKYRQC